MNTASPELERRLLHGLSAQWEVEKAGLPAAFARLLMAPIFSLSDSQTAWGQWYRERREITIRRILVLDYTWEQVRTVLRHEMAHQIADELLGGDTTPHGPVFRRACELLRIPPLAGAELEPMSAASTVTTEQDRLLQRVKKLLALAQSANRHEAELAMEKAHEFIARYNLDLLASHADRQYVTRCLGQAAIRRDALDYQLAGLLQQHYFVRCIWVPMFVPAKDGMGTVLEISGTFENLEWAHYVYDFVRQYIYAEWLRYAPTAPPGVPVHTQRAYLDFAVGVVRGFSAKIGQAASAHPNVQNSPNPAPSEHGVMRRTQVATVHDAQLEAYFYKKYPHSRKVTRGGRQENAAAVLAGHQAGGRLVIARGIAGSRTGGRLLADGGGVAPVN